MVDTELTATDFQNGCFHLHVKDGEIKNGFSHLSFPDSEYVLHMKAEAVLSPEEFVASHAADADELKISPRQKIHNLGPESIAAKSLFE